MLDCIPYMAGAKGWPTEEDETREMGAAHGNCTCTFTPAPWRSYFPVSCAVLKANVLIFVYIKEAYLRLLRTFCLDIIWAALQMSSCCCWGSPCIRRTVDDAEPIPANHHPSNTHNISDPNGSSFDKRMEE